VEAVLERTNRLVEAYEDEARRLVPDAASLFDAHVHVGRDIDGMVAPLEELVGFLRRSRIERAFAFCLDEPDREPAFRAANDRTLEAAAQSNGLLVPFARVDLAEGPIEELTRSLERGARGIKLHPRAQGFHLNDERLTPVFALAAERRVPILIHGGRGLPPIAAHLRRLHDAYPEAPLIIAHAGIADLAALSECFACRPGVYFDTSVWSAIDLLDMFSRISPGQVLYASDFPYGQQPGALLLTLRTARLAGLTEGEVRDILGRSAAQIADEEAPPKLSPPKGLQSFDQPIAFARIHHYLAMATPLLWTRQADTIGVLGLAVNACAERDGYAEERERIAELLDTASDLWRTLPETEDETERRRLSRATFRLIHIADILTLTPEADAD
jgi:predicted TIM-barrel fold metal-dependent hydrolase